MDLLEYCEFVLLVTGENVGNEFINIRAPHLSESIPCFCEGKTAFLVLADGVWITRGYTGSSDEIYVPLAAFYDPEEHWDHEDSDDLAADVISRDGRLMGPCGNCGEITNRTCKGEFTYRFGKRVVYDEIDYECREFACNTCKWCTPHKEVVLGLIDQWGGVPIGVTKFNTLWRESVFGRS